MTRLIRSAPPPPPPPRPSPDRERTHYLVRGTIAPAFIAGHAVTAADAMAFEPGSPTEVTAFKSMIADGSIRPNGRDRYWFDMDAYEAAADARRRRFVPLWIAIAVIGAVVATMFYRG